ncbi:MAG: polysaccharide biosynthesis/export family protein [bacterium]
MKNSILATLVLSVAFAVTAAAQVNPAIRTVNSSVSSSVTVKSETPPEPARATRARVLNQTQKSPATNSPSANAQSLQAHAKANFKNRARLESLPAEVSTGDNTRVRSVTTSTAAVDEPKAIANKNVVPPNANPNASVRTFAPLLLPTPSQIYRVGVGDVLDIQLNNNASQESTLFTVLSGGTLEYPLAGGPVQVTGMTTSEIAVTLRTKIKMFEDPAVVVNVRDYASHTVTISGFVAAPGTKTLRREAVPLYALLAESVVMPDAARATVIRSTGNISIDLNDPNLSAMLVLPGDVIKVLGPAAVTEFFFVAGEVKLPGQKAYHSGLTLTQAILAAGGATNSAAERVRVSRQGTDGRLLTEEFNLRKILDGKVADPLLRKDDRIELTAAN